MLKKFLTSLFGPPPPPRVEFTDPLLGILVPEETGWSASVVKGDDTFRCTIGGDRQPDDALLAHAHDIFNDYTSFKKRVKDFMASASAEYPADVRAEIAGLAIDNIALFWPDRPNDGMIFFRGPQDDSRLWRCDYIARTPTGLGCDT
ncbi:MAG: hypothetical protein HY290_06100 [Planctomycetia bacterium]|nr:hypothetical protein [Planctomycetia bacterium]